MPPPVKYIPFESRTLPPTQKTGGGPLSYIPRAMRAVGNVALDLISSKVEASNEVDKTTKPFSAEAAPVIFGEVSNRPDDKKELEARVILTTAVNRMREYKKRGMDKSLDDVLRMPNQYQAYGGKEYTKYKTGTTSEPDRQKKESIDKIVQTLLKEIEEGKFKPVSDSAYYYIHNDDGTIAYDDKRALFK